MTSYDAEVGRDVVACLRDDEGVALSEMFSLNVRVHSAPGDQVA